MNNKPNAKNNRTNANNSLKWENQNAIKHYQYFVKDFGKPTATAKERYGMALWTKDNMNDKYLDNDNIFYEHLIRDEDVQHNCPAKHTDFIYSYLQLYVPPKKVPSVLSLSGSVNYDALKRLLSARCGSIEANIATLKLLLDILLDKEVSVQFGNENYTYKGIKDIQQKNIYGMTINQTTNPEFVKQLYTDLVQSYQEYTTETKDIPIGYWSAAFSYVDDKCLPPNKENKICPDNNLEGGKKKSNKPKKRSNKPKKRSNKPKKSGGKANKPKRSGGKVNRPKRSGSKVNKPKKSGGKVNRPKRSGGKVNRPKMSK